MLKVCLLPLLAVIGGIGGFFLRRWELSTAFEISGLAIPWTAASVMLIALSILLALAVAILCRKPKNELKTYGDAFFAPGNWFYLAALALASACLLVGALVGFKSAMTSWPRSILHLALWALCIAAFFCVLNIALSNFRSVSRKYNVTLLIPAYALCLWLVSAYQQHAADPVVLDYVYELFAIICTLLGLYFAAAFSFAKAKVWRCAFFSLMGIYFSIVTLADSHDRATQLLYLFAILYLLATVTVLLKNAFTTPPKHLKNNVNNTQEVIPDE